MSETLIVANPVSGSGRGRVVAGLAHDRLAGAGREVELVLTRGAGDARDAARSFLDAGGRHVVACGGDGTVHEIAGALAGTEATLSLLPCGRGNDLARALGIPRDPSRAIATILGGRVRRIDVGRIEETIFTTVASVGLDAEVGHRVHAGKRRLPGTLAYVAAFLSTAGRYRCPAVRIEGDFGVFEGALLMVAAGNTPCYGGGMRIAPSADCADGLLEVCLVPEVPLTTVLRIFPRVFRGTHVRHPAVRIERTRSLRIESPSPLAVLADGEPAGRTPVTLSAWPRALAVTTP